MVDPPPPIESSGVSVISCLEFYQAAHARLVPGGVMMQWVPYGQTLDEFKAHVRTFRAVFPNVIVAQGPGGYGFFMFGSDQPIDFDEASIREVLARPGILADMSSAFDSPKLDVDGWVGAIPQLIRLSGDQVERLRRPRPAHHRRPAAPGVLLPPPLAGDAVAAPVAGAGPRALSGRVSRVNVEDRRKVASASFPATR